MTLASALVSNPTLFLGFVALLGLLVGSFINVIVYRLPIMLERAWQSSEARNELPTEAFNLAVPRSHCPSCAQQLSAVENVPSSVSCFCADVADTANPEYLLAILSLR